VKGRRPSFLTVYIAKPQKVTTLTCYIKISVVYFVLKLLTHTHTLTLGTSEIYFTSCENGILPPL